MKRATYPKEGNKIVSKKKNHTWKTKNNLRPLSIMERDQCLAFRIAGRVCVELQAIIGGLPVGPEEFRSSSKGIWSVRREILLHLLTLCRRCWFEPFHNTFYSLDESRCRINFSPRSHVLKGTHWGCRNVGWFWRVKYTPLNVFSAI